MERKVLTKVTLATLVIAFVVLVAVIIITAASHGLKALIKDIENEENY